MRYLIKDRYEFLKLHAQATVLVPKTHDLLKKQRRFAWVFTFLRIGIVIPLFMFPDTGIGTVAVACIFFAGGIFDWWQVYRTKRNLRIVTRAKETMDFVMAFNATPDEDEEWKGPRDPFTFEPKDLV